MELQQAASPQIRPARIPRPAFRLALPTPAQSALQTYHGCGKGEGKEKKEKGGSADGRCGKKKECLKSMACSPDTPGVRSSAHNGQV